MYVVSLLIVLWAGCHAHPITTTTSPAFDPYIDCLEVDLKKIEELRVEPEGETRDEEELAKKYWGWEEWDKLKALGDRQPEGDLKNRLLHALRLLGVAIRRAEQKGDPVTGPSKDKSQFIGPTSEYDQDYSVELITGLPKFSLIPSYLLTPPTRVTTPSGTERPHNNTEESPSTIPTSTSPSENPILLAVLNSSQEELFNVGSTTVYASTTDSSIDDSSQMWTEFDPTGPRRGDSLGEAHSEERSVERSSSSPRPFSDQTISHSTLYETAAPLPVSRRPVIEEEVNSSETLDDNSASDSPDWSDNFLKSIARAISNDVTTPEPYDAKVLSTEKHMRDNNAHFGTTQNPITSPEIVSSTAFGPISTESYLALANVFNSTDEKFSFEPTSTANKIDIKSRFKVNETYKTQGIDDYVSSPLPPFETTDLFTTKNILGIETTTILSKEESEQFKGPIVKTIHYNKGHSTWNRSENIPTEFYSERTKYSENEDFPFTEEASQNTDAEIKVTPTTINFPTTESDEVKPTQVYLETTKEDEFQFKVVPTEIENYERETVYDNKPTEIYSVQTGDTSGAQFIESTLQDITTAKFLPTETENIGTENVYETNNTPFFSGTTNDHKTEAHSYSTIPVNALSSEDYSTTENWYKKKPTKFPYGVTNDHRKHVGLLKNSSDSDEIPSTETYNPTTEYIDERKRTEIYSTTTNYATAEGVPFFYPETHGERDSSTTEIEYELKPTQIYDVVTNEDTSVFPGTLTTNGRDYSTTNSVNEMEPTQLYRETSSDNITEALPFYSGKQNEDLTTKNDYYTAESSRVYGIIPTQKYFESTEGKTDASEHLHSTKQIDVSPSTTDGIHRLKPTHFYSDVTTEALFTRHGKISSTLPEKSYEITPTPIRPIVLNRNDIVFTGDVTPEVRERSRADSNGKIMRETTGEKVTTRSPDKLSSVWTMTSYDALEVTDDRPVGGGLTNNVMALKLEASTESPSSFTFRIPTTENHLKISPIPDFLSTALSQYMVKNAKSPCVKVKPYMFIRNRMCRKVID